MNDPFLSLNCIFKYGFIEIIEIKNKIVLGLCWFLDDVHQVCLGNPQQSVLIDETPKLSRAPGAVHPFPPKSPRYFLAKS